MLLNICYNNIENIQLKEGVIYERRENTSGAFEESGIQ